MKTEYKKETLIIRCSFGYTLFIYIKEGIISLRAKCYRLAMLKQAYHCSRLIAFFAGFLGVAAFFAAGFFATGALAGAGAAAALSTEG